MMMKKERGVERGVLVMNLFIVGMLFIGFLIPPITAEQSTTSLLLENGFIHEGSFGKINTIGIQSQKREQLTLQLGQSDVAITPQTVAPGQQIQIGINAGINGVNQFIDIYDANSQLQNEFIQLNCGANVCTGYQTATFAIPSRWVGRYYLLIFDHQTETFGKFFFTVSQIQRSTNYLVQDTGCVGTGSDVDNFIGIARDAANNSLVNVEVKAFMCDIGALFGDVSCIEKDTMVTAADPGFEGWYQLDITGVIGCDEGKPIFFAINSVPAAETFAWQGSRQSSGTDDLHQLAGIDAPPVVVLHNPDDNIVSPQRNVVFNCSATDDFKVNAIELFTNVTGIWNSTDSALAASLVSSQSLFDGVYLWNCRATDNNSHASFAPASRTLVVDYCVDSDGDGFAVQGADCGAVDCDDRNNLVYPGASERCDNLDNDCDGNLSDDGVDESWFNQPTSCGDGECGSNGSLLCSNGAQSDTCVPDAPSAELCDGLDNDCDNLIDDNEFIAENYTLTDSCGSGNCAGIKTCLQGSSPTLPVWSVCSSNSADCGICCNCDQNGAETYNGSQDTGLSGTDCSFSDLPAIATCFNNPDNDNLTFDQHPAVYSQCQAIDQCASVSYGAISSSCSKINCNAGCESGIDCNDNNPDTVDICNGCICEFIANCGNNAFDAREECELINGSVQYTTPSRCNGKILETASSCNLTTCQASFTQSCNVNFCNADCNTGDIRDTNTDECVENDLWNRNEQCGSTCEWQLANYTLAQNCSVSCLPDQCDTASNRFLDYAESVHQCSNASCVVAPANCTTPLTSACTLSCGAGCETDFDCGITECSNNSGCYRSNALVPLQECYGSTDCALRTYEDAASSCDIFGSCGCLSGSCTSYAVLETDLDNDSFDSSCDQDCDDTNQYLFPNNVNAFCDCNNDDGIAQGQVEICNGLDDDCDGIVDDSGVCSGNVLVCNLTDAYWQPSSALNGTVVDLIVTGENCLNKLIVFDIWEKAEALEIDGDDDVLEDPSNATVLGSSASTNWTALYDGYEFHALLGDPEYYFVAYLGENSSINITSSLLDVFASCPDRDGDGFSDVSCGGNDCNDNASGIYPGAEELCGDAIDQNCDLIDPSCGSGDINRFGSAGGPIRIQQSLCGEPYYDCSAWSSCQNGIESRTCYLKPECSSDQTALSSRPDDQRVCEEEIGAGVIIEASSISSRILSEYDYEVKVSNPTEKDLSDVEVSLDLPGSFESDGIKKIGTLSAGQTEIIKFRIVIPYTNSESESLSVVVKSEGTVVDTERAKITLNTPSFMIAAEPSLTGYTNIRTIKMSFVINNKGNQAKQGLALEFNMNLGASTKVLDLINNIDVGADQMKEVSKVYDISSLSNERYQLLGRLYDQGSVVETSTSSIDLTNK